MFVPNQYAPAERIIFLVIGVALTWWALDGFLDGEMYLPGRKEGIYLRDGLAVVLGVVGALTGGVACFSALIDHYDRRDNEKKYREFFVFCKYVAIAAITSAVVLQLRAG
ncbi:TPA: hypothetical protein ACGJRU_006357 [Pseudomonas aeruginosa]|uniref:hypothetical protein n=1 Tax=Pseudomonas TaxID=286 RepID=UPI00053ED202|nr:MULTISPECIES: hypothetical protein [Pseudomonas]MBD9428080.1 hypothetical protein [Pseudomonas sp. PDM15]MBX6882458.1 hypothetical protein [Pseudomonas aeruginosa]MBX6932591.1 hypothetical protein [Pseudomonas aeruginosa]MCZ9867263.1 hypothetical protein [Pseudomonas aeruginosa]MCZ9906334.1 hypothetical protein [Pseudomonas aeruginosa]